MFFMNHGEVGVVVDLFVACCVSELIGEGMYYYYFLNCFAHRIGSAAAHGIDFSDILIKAVLMF